MTGGTFEFSASVSRGTKDIRQDININVESVIPITTTGPRTGSLDELPVTSARPRKVTYYYHMSERVVLPKFLHRRE